MPIGVIAAGVGAVGAIGGAYLSSKAQSKAASSANAAEQNAAAQQYALGQESLALNKDIYNTNFNTLSPWVARGNVAGDAYSNLLGLPAAKPMASPLAPPGGGTYSGGTGTFSGQAPYTQAQIDAMQHDGTPGNAAAAQNVLNQWNAAHPQTPAAPAPVATAPSPPAPAANSGALQQQAQAAIAAGANPAAVNARLATLTPGG